MEQKQLEKEKQAKAKRDKLKRKLIKRLHPTFNKLACIIYTYSNLKAYIEKCQSTSNLTP